VPFELRNAVAYYVMRLVRGQATNAAIMRRLKTNPPNAHIIGLRLSVFSAYMYAAMLLTTLVITKQV
jgi:hypothetical protein